MMDLFALGAGVVGAFTLICHTYYGIKHRDFSWSLFFGGALLLILCASALLG
jgi:hypothetical protein